MQKIYTCSSLEGYCTKTKDENIGQTLNTSCNREKWKFYLHHVFKSEFLDELLTI